MKHFKHILTTSLMSKRILNNPFFVLETKLHAKSNLNQKLFSKAFVKKFSFSNLNLPAFKFPLVIVNFKNFKLLHSYQLKKNNAIFIKIFNLIFLQNFFQVNNFSADIIFKKLAALLTKTFLLLFIIKNYKK